MREIKLPFRMFGAPIILQSPILVLVVLYTVRLMDFWAILLAVCAALIVVTCHEIGHAYLVKRYSLRVHRIEIAGIYGLCHYDPTGNAILHAKIAWGGVLAQLIIAAIAGIFYVTMHYFDRSWNFNSGYTGFLCEILLRDNLILVGFNLLPITPLDGAKAWNLPFLLFHRWFQQWQKHKNSKNSSQTLPKTDISVPTLAQQKAKKQAEESASHNPKYDIN